MFRFVVTVAVAHITVIHFAHRRHRDGWRPHTHVLISAHASACTSRRVRIHVAFIATYYWHDSPLHVVSLAEFATRVGLGVALEREVMVGS